MRFIALAALLAAPQIAFAAKQAAVPTPEAAKPAPAAPVSKGVKLTAAAFTLMTSRPEPAVASVRKALLLPQFKPNITAAAHNANAPETDGPKVIDTEEADARQAHEDSLLRLMGDDFAGQPLVYFDNGKSDLGRLRDIVVNIGLYGRMPLTVVYPEGSGNIFRTKYSAAIAKGKLTLLRLPIADGKIDSGSFSKVLGKSPGANKPAVLIAAPSLEQHVHTAFTDMFKGEKPWRVTAAAFVSVAVEGSLAKPLVPPTVEGATIQYLLDAATLLKPGSPFALISATAGDLIEAARVLRTAFKAIHIEYVAETELTPDINLAEITAMAKAAQGGPIDESQIPVNSTEKPGLLERLAAFIPPWLGGPAKPAKVSDKK